MELAAMDAAGATIQALHPVLIRLQEQDLSGIPVEQVADAVVGLRKMVDWLEVEWTRRVAELADRRGIDLEATAR